MLGKTYFSMMFPLLAKVFNSLAWASEPLLIGEMAPTSIRNMFYGATGTVGEIGSVVAPFLNVLVIYAPKFTFPNQKMKISLRTIINYSYFASDKHSKFSHLFFL